LPALALVGERSDDRLRGTRRLPCGGRPLLGRPEQAVVRRRTRTEDVSRHAVHDFDGPRDLGVRGPVAAAARRLDVARLEWRVEASVGVDLEGADHEVLRQRCRQGRSRAGSLEVEAVVGRRPRLLALEDAGEGALHLVEGPLRERLVAHRALEREPLQRAPDEHADRKRERYGDQEDRQADPSHPTNR
jgi:hypothetical protein